MSLKLDDLTTDVATAVSLLAGAEATKAALAQAQADLTDAQAKIDALDAQLKAALTPPTPAT